MTGRQLIKNLMCHCENLDEEIPFVMVTRDSTGLVVAKSDPADYTCYLTVTGKLCAESTR
jgi:hypothetical protein